MSGPDPGPTVYRIEVDGHPGARLLRPFVDEFTVSATTAGTTVLVGPVRDSSQLNGLLAHLASVRIDLVSVMRQDPGQGAGPDSGSLR